MRQCALMQIALDGAGHRRGRAAADQRGGRGACGICGFRGELTEIEYDRVKDKRSPEERARLRAELNAPPKTREEIRRKEEPAPAPKDYGFTQQTFLDLATLDKL